MKQPKFMKTIAKAMKKNSPQILTGIGITGMITSAVLAVKATPKALQLIEEEKQAQNVEQLPVVDTVKSTWKCYIPSVVTGTLSAACLIGANSIGTRRTAALATAYKISETALAEYKENVMEIITDDQKAELKQKSAEKKITKKYTKTDLNDVYIHNTGGGDDLFYDPFIDRYFRSSVEYIQDKVNKLNADMLNGYDMMNLNMFYSSIGLETCEVGDILGWNIFNGRNGMIAVDMNNSIVMGNKSWIVLEFENPPKYEFDE